MRLPAAVFPGRLDSRPACRTVAAIRSALRLMVLLVMIALHGQPALAAGDTISRMKQSGAIVLGYRESALPISFQDPQGRPTGYAVELCLRAVDLMKQSLGLPGLTIRWQPVTSANRIPLVTRGSVDLECGSTTNTAERQKRVAFGPTYFVSRLAVAFLGSSGLKSLSQLDGQPVVSVTGSTSVVAIKRFAESRGIVMKDFYARDHAQAFDALLAGRASAVVLDHILLAGFIASSTSPDAFVLFDETLAAEAYAAMLRANDPAFKELVMKTFGELMQSGEAERIYEKWFTRPTPPKGVNFNLPLSPELRQLFRQPSDTPM